MSYACSRIHVFATGHYSQITSATRKVTELNVQLGMTNMSTDALKEKTNLLHEQLTLCHKGLAEVSAISDGNTQVLEAVKSQLAFIDK